MGKTLGYGEITVANVTEPFTVMLTNEAQQFATDSNRKVTSAQSYYTDIIVIRGSQERTDYTIGNITSGSGITVSKNSKRVTFSVSAGTTIGADAGVIEIPITLDGQTVKKQFSWSCGKQGPQGVKGQDGNSFAWNMLSETNCGKKHWGTESSGGKYSVEDFITEDNIDAVKLICTEAISTSNWSYVSFKDIKMLKQLKPSTKYTLSYDIKANRSGAISHSICKGDVSNFCTNTVVVNNIIGNETWQHISVVLTTNDLKTTPTNEILYLGRNALSKVGYSIIKNLKLVEGDIDTPWSPSQSDIEGKGVVETVQYYLATSQASGVTSSTSGWSTDITTQKLTADKKYLWNCYQTKYSDGTSEPISTPKVIGVYGDKGQNAKNLSITPSSQYFKSTDGGKTFAPNTITIKPTIQGEISFGKWQYSIDGGVSFADIVSGQKGLTINNNVLTVSKDSSLYSDGVTMVTFRAVANDSSFYDTCSIAKIYDVSDIGDGRNLLTGVSSYTKDTPFEKTDSRADGWTMYQNIITSIELEAGKKYVLQAKTDGNWAANHDTNGQDPSKKLVTLWLCSDKTNNCFDMRQGYAVFTPTVTAKYKLRVNQYSNGTDAYTIHLWDIKLEKGSSPTGWTPAPEDLQTAILSTKSEISDVSLKVDKNKQAIEQRVEKTTYQQDLNLVKGDISKANEGLNKWRYEIYPKSLFTDKPEDQRKISLDVFARNKNIIPTQSILLDDTKLGYFNYDDNYIGYAVTFVKMSEATKLETTFVHDDAGSFYLNGKLICTNGTNNFYSSATPDTVSCTLVKGWNCLEVVINEGAGSEGFKFGTVLSQLSTCQLMNCYYAMVTGRESQITNTLVQNTIDIEGVSTKVGKVTSIIGENGENFTDFKNDYSDFKQTMNGFKTTVGQTYVTKDDFNGLEIGGRNLLLYSQTVRAHNDYYNVGWLTDEVETFNGCPVWSVKNQWGKLGWSFKSHVIDRGLVKVGDTLTYSLYAKTNNASGKRIACSYRFKGNAQGYWFNDSAFNVDTSWARYSVTFTVTKDMLATDTYMNEIGFGETASMSGDDKVYYACPKLERGTKATDYTPAPEDNEINGQNLVSNLPSNWEQGGINGGQAVGSTYASIKSSTAYRIRIKDIFSVSGNITVSAGGTTTNSSKETLSFYGTLYDAKKGLLRETGWKSFPSTINCGDAKYMSIILRWGDGTKTQIAPSDISQICLKIERGTSATPFTLAPEDVNGKIVNVETIANQTAKKFEWIVKGGDKSSSMVLTDDFLNIVANNINLTGKVTFNSFDSAAQKKINDIDTKAGNASTAASTAQASANNAKAAADKAQSSVDRLEIGGRNLVRLGGLSGNGATSFSYDKTTDTYTIVSPVVSTVWGIGAAVKYDDNHKVLIPYGKTYILSFEVKVPQALSINIDINNYAVSGSSWAGNDNDAGSARGQSSYSIPANTWTKVWVRWANTNTKNTNKVDLYDNSSIGLVTKDCTSAVTWQIRHVKGELGNKPTDWTPAPEDVSQDATNKASQALTDAKNYSSNAVNWVTSNGSSTTSLNSMVKKWTDGAVSDTTQINGGWIKANTITASKIALADFTNYSQLTRDTAATYGFAVTDDTDGTWFSTQGIRRDQFISEIFPCNGGESYLIEYDISTNAKGANNSTDTKNYIGVAIGVYGYTGTVGSNGLPNKATNIWYATRVTGSETAPSIHVKTTITTSTATKQFRIFLQSNGYYFEGTTKIRNLSVRRMYGGTLIVDGSITADKIATDAIKSRNYISSGGTQGSFLNLSDGSFQSPNLSWDANGNLIAKNANLSGKITATDGSIGKFKITDQWLITGSGSTCAGLGGSGQAFWAGAENSTVAPFRVGYDGSFTSSNADISGKITATNGKIGRYDITSTYLMTNSGSNASGIGGNQAFWAGAEDSNSAPFRVGYDGVLWAENAAIRGSIETGNLGDEGDTVVIMNGHIGIQGTSNNVEIYSTGFKFGIDGDYYLESVSDGVKCYRNLYATDLKASGWLYAGEVHSSGAVVIASDSESFYWAHGYQIARGTSWGGVCIGDDSQGLRLYGTSIWASHGISTSDENLKENFTTLDQYEDFYMNLNPIGFNYIGDYDGKKTHFGFGAHKTEDILESEGYDSDKFAVVTHRPLVQEDIEKRFGKDVEVDIETEYGISYTEFIALNTHMIQKTRRELTKVKQEKADLEARLQAIEAKLGL